MRGRRHTPGRAVHKGEYGADDGTAAQPKKQSAQDSFGHSCTALAMSDICVLSFRTCIYGYGFFSCTSNHLHVLRLKSFCFLYMHCQYIYKGMLHATGYAELQTLCTAVWGKISATVG